LEALPITFAGIVSFELFDRGSHQLFAKLNSLPPHAHDVRPFIDTHVAKPKTSPPVVGLGDWKTVKEAMRNYTFQNFNPGLLPNDHPLRKDIFDKISSTSGLFLALEPQVFVSKIRARIFRNWKAAEDYYANSLRELKRFLQGQEQVDADEEESESSEESKPASGVAE
jgi:hypothetical protein